MTDGGTVEAAASTGPVTSTDGAALHSTEFRLSWGECDPAGIVYYATYLEWAERVHGEWWYLAGRPIRPPSSEGGPAFVVRHVSCDYLSAPEPMTRIGCSMSLQRIGSTSFTMSFRFVRVEDGTDLAELWLTAVFVDGSLEPTSVPSDVRALLDPGCGRSPGASG